MDRFSWLNQMSIGKVLELGCEDGKVFRNNESIEWYGIDNFNCIYQPKAGFRPDGTQVIEDIPKWQENRKKELLKLLKGRNFVEGDAYHLPYKRNMFDTMVYSEILEHVPDPVKLLKVGLKHLKNKGRLLITVPDEYSWPKELDPFGHSGHLWHFREWGVRDILNKVKLPVKLFVHTPRSWNGGFVFWYIILQKIRRKKNG